MSPQRDPNPNTVVCPTHSAPAEVVGVKSSSPFPVLNKRDRHDLHPTPTGAIGHKVTAILACCTRRSVTFVGGEHWGEVRGETR